MTSPIERLCRTIYTTTGHKLSPADLEVQNVQANTNLTITRNTECLLVAREKGRLKGTMQFYYNRLDLAKLFHGEQVVLTMPFGSRITTQSLAGLIADRFGIELLPDDVEQSGEFYLNQFPFDIQLTAVPGSLAVTGSLNITIHDAGYETQMAVGVPNLSGLNSPTGDFTRTQGVLYSWFWKPDPNLTVMLKGKNVGDVVDADILPYLNTMSQDAWVNEATAANFNINGAKLVYLGNREDNDKYAVGITGEIAVIQLTDLCANIAGDLVIALA